MVKQSPRLPASHVSANSASLWSSRIREDPTQDKKKKKKPQNKQEHRNIDPDKSLDCVMTSAGTLKLNFSEAFKTLFKRKHSHSHEVTWHITEFTLPINHLERRDGLRNHRPAPSAENGLLTNGGRDFSDNHNDNSLRSCLWLLSNSNKVPQSNLMM